MSLSLLDRAKSEARNFETGAKRKKDMYRTLVGSLRALPYTSPTSYLQSKTDTIPSSKRMRLHPIEWNEISAKLRNRHEGLEGKKTYRTLVSFVVQFNHRDGGLSGSGRVKHAEEGDTHREISSAHFVDG